MVWFGLVFFAVGLDKIPPDKSIWENITKHGSPTGHGTASDQSVQIAPIRLWAAMNGEYCMKTNSANLISGTSCAARLMPDGTKVGITDTY